MDRIFTFDVLVTFALSRIARAKRCVQMLKDIDDNRTITSNFLLSDSPAAREAADLYKRTACQTSRKMAQRWVKNGA
jgi:hypothetical protein